MHYNFAGLRCSRRAEENQGEEKTVKIRAFEGNFFSQEHETIMLIVGITQDIPW